jgi:hypothetical protein
MLDHTLESAICSLLKANRGLSQIHFFTGIEDESHQHPAITVVSKSESLAGSTEVFRAEVQIIVETRARDTQPGAHAGLVSNVGSVLAHKTAALTSINAGGAIQLCGYALAGCEQEAAEERFRTVISIKAGYRLPAN